MTTQQGRLTQTSSLALLDGAQAFERIDAAAGDAATALPSAVPTASSDGFPVVSNTTLIRLSVVGGVADGTVTLWVYNEALDLWNTPTNPDYAVRNVGGVTERARVAGYQRVYLQDSAAAGYSGYIEQGVLP